MKNGGNAVNERTTRERKKSKRSVPLGGNNMYFVITTFPHKTNNELMRYPSYCPPACEHDLDMSANKPSLRGNFESFFYNFSINTA